MLCTRETVLACALGLVPRENKMSALRAFLDPRRRNVLQRQFMEAATRGARGGQDGLYMLWVSWKLKTQKTPTGELPTLWRKLPRKNLLRLWALLGIHDGTLMRGEKRLSLPERRTLHRFCSVLEASIKKLCDAIERGEKTPETPGQQEGRTEAPASCASTSPPSETAFKTDS